MKDSYKSTTAGPNLSKNYSRISEIQEKYGKMEDFINLLRFYFKHK